MVIIESKPARVTVVLSVAILARDSIMQSALYAIARPSLRPSVRHTGGLVKNG